jgi:hypothetical protein
MSTNPTSAGLPTGGGTVQNWTIVTSQRTAWVRSPTSAIDAMRITFATVPHGVEASTMVAYTTFALEGADLIVQPIAFGIETILDIPAADDAWFIEDSDASGLLQGFIEYLVTVQPTDPSVPGPISSTVIVPITRVADYTYVQGLLDTEKTRLRGLPGA